jgi:hypothetical protein
MNPRALKTEMSRGNENEAPAPSLRSVIRKSALLNAMIVLTSFPVLVYAGGPKAVVLTVQIMVGISVLIWTATFALFSFAALPRIFRIPVSPAIQSDPAFSADGSGLADRWLDEPAFTQEAKPPRPPQAGPEES